MSLVGDFKDILSIVNKIGNVDLVKKIADLQSEVYALAEENRSLNNEVRKLKEVETFKDKLKFKSPFWYLEEDEIPFCPRCWENDSKAIHLIPGIDRSFEKCPQCKSIFEITQPDNSRITFLP